ncbi:hypothetical protein MRX96_034039 [Rhipicephalus microplus]
MHRGANGACAIILPLPKSDCHSACLGFAGGMHIDTLLLDAPAIMGFRIERDSVKFANYKGAATITTALTARWLRHNAVFYHAGFCRADDHRRSLPRVAASCADGIHRGANGACAIILSLPKSDCRSACLGFAGGTHIDTLKLDAPAIMGFHIERDTVKFANYKMFTATLCHVLLPLVQTVYTVAPIKHTPTFYRYPNKMAAPLVLASPEERISNSYYWML